MNYAKKPRQYLLTPTRKKAGKAIAKGSKKSVAAECMKDPVIHKYILANIGRIVRSELASMCSSEANSMLQQHQQMHLLSSHGRIFTKNWKLILRHCYPFSKLAHRQKGQD